MTTVTSTAGGDQGITLRDVVVHMQSMEQRLSAGIKQNKTAIERLDTGLTTRIDHLEKNMNERMDALQEDLDAVANDTLAIRRHVGMPVPIED